MEWREGYLRFLTDKPRLDVWSELFCEDSALRFAPSAVSPAVVRRLAKGEDPVDVAAEVMRAYARAAKLVDSETEENKENK